MRLLCDNGDSSTDQTWISRYLHVEVSKANDQATVMLHVYSDKDEFARKRNSAKKKQGKFVHLIAKLDKSEPITYDPIKNPNYLSFYAVDSLGGKTQVIYHNSKPGDLEKSERIVLKGKMEADHFECQDILLKCPSKYKDDKKMLEKDICARSPRNRTWTTTERGSSSPAANTLSAPSTFCCRLNKCD